MSEEQNEALEKAFHQMMNIYIKPEVSRRQKLGELPFPLDLFGAQIIFFAGGGYEVRINEEVAAEVKVRLKDDKKPEIGKFIHENEIKEIGFASLTENDDPNAGHVTFMRLNDTWTMSFDLIYNKGLSQRNIDNALQFIETAKYCKTNENKAAFIDNMFSAYELLAKAIILPNFPPDYQEKSSHKSIHSQFNREAKADRIPSEIRDAFNKLARLRKPARYALEEISLTSTEIEEMIAGALKLLEIAQIQSARVR